ncbi:MAG: right-handed parallel beta-helix repeat-containing protein, partial [Planctomycetes bacterium]|nr:right-handed parallel beta-helix repeat-containing protein [Planctomycetota bacterium]
MRNVFCVVALLLLSATCGRAATFVVAPSGNDANPGTADKPLATLEAARDAARKAGPDAHRIVVMPGEYFLSATFELDTRDNGLTVEAEGDGTATLYGGVLVTGWRPDGEKLWCADLPGVKEGAWDFRALVVAGRMPPRARLPESGTFLHKSVFDARWLSSVGGGWERKPTPQELTTMLYDPQDIPPTLEVKNAEVRVYHMWDESMVGIAANDTERHMLVFSNAAKSPPGAFRVKKYVIFNTREGMTRPGQWYLDRAAGTVVYWPLADEKMADTKVIAPRLGRIIHIAGTRETPAEKITIRGLALRATTTPLKAGGFGAYAFDGAVRMERARGCALENLDVGCVGGQGVQSSSLADCRIAGCHVHHTGACGIKTGGAETLVASNHIHDVGVYYPSAIALPAYSSAKGDRQGLHVYRNEIHDTPYSGIAGGGANLLIEENLIYRVMREMQDGGAIYGGMRNSILRGNMVRDVVKVGEGYGVSAYYLDEGAQDCIVERNVSVGVARPSHNHIARNIIIRDNVFIVETDMALSFQRSAGCTFSGNTLFVPGKISIGQPNAIKTWANNVVFRNGTGENGVPQAFTIDDAMPPVAEPKRMTWPATAVRVDQPPT